MPRDVIAFALRAGAVAAGFARCQSVDIQACGLYDRWIAEGRNAGMAYMERYADIRRDPRLLLEGARSILCCAFPYGQLSRSGLFSEYALGDDYHEVLRSRLEPVAEYMRQLVPGSSTRICVDTAPLRERYWAREAGIGFIGLNNQLIVPGIGSKVFLAEIIWTVETDYGIPLDTNCGRCRACVRACPGHALDGKGGIDCGRCVSYLTIEHRGALPGWLDLSGCIYGCDICQNVCPHNRCAMSPLPEFSPRQELINLTRDKIAAMTASEFSAIFRHSAIKRVKLAGLQRNAAHTYEDS